MCGIAGFLEFRNRRDGDARRLQATASRMAGTLNHRGPDDDGVWVDEATGLGLGFRRLSIIDLSPAGHQPMVSASGRNVIIFNGEIYNHSELRSELVASGIRLRGRSDTEILLAAIESWGIERALRRSVGMFAFAVWDTEQRRLTLARDRIGEKPLYYGVINGALLFGSELKALVEHPSWEGEIDPFAVTELLRRRYIPAPASIFRAVQKLLPGSYLTLDRQMLEKGQPLPAPVLYWDAVSVLAAASDQPVAGGYAAISEQLEEVLCRAVSDQMVADVPLGAFLSGGIDSATIVSLMQAASTRPVNTFTVAFDDAQYNEGDDARRVARHLGTNHTELTVTASEARDLVPTLPSLYDEPMADFSAIPTFLVAQLARKHVTVCLSGDGGDELFCGYRRYVQGGQLWRWMCCLPSPVRDVLGKLLAGATPGLRQAAGGWLEPYLRRHGGSRRASDQLETLSYVLGSRDMDDLYRRLTSDWRDPQALLRVCLQVANRPDRGELAGRITHSTAATNAPPFADVRSRMMIRDLLTYLPDDILVKVDRATMGNSLESRAPFLDHRVVEFAWRIPPQLRIRAGKGKWLLRQVLYRHLPAALMDRPKKGFTPPLAAWLRGPLRPWAESMLDPRRLADDGMFEPGPIRTKWEQHLSGTHNWVTPIWNLLTFLSWRESHASWLRKPGSSYGKGVAA